MRQRAARGYGPRRIAAELRERGIADGLAAEVLDEADSDWFAAAAAVRLKKFGERPTLITQRAKQTRFLEYRGFESAQIRHALEHGNNDEDF